MSYDLHDFPCVSKLLADPSVSYWLQGALRTALERDPLDAMRDAELLSEALKLRWNDIKLLTGLKAKLDALNPELGQYSGSNPHNYQP